MKVPGLGRCRRPAQMPASRTKHITTFHRQRAAQTLRRAVAALSRTRAPSEARLPARHQHRAVLLALPLRRLSSPYSFTHLGLHGEEDV